jgi:hypothetical protein
MQGFSGILAIFTGHFKNAVNAFRCELTLLVQGENADSCVVDLFLTSAVTGCKPM